MTRLEEIKARLDAATAGPWDLVIDDTGGEFTNWPSVEADHEDASVVHRAGFKQRHWGDWSCRQANRNATFIANAPADIAHLLEQNARLREALEAALPVVTWADDEDAPRLLRKALKEQSNG